MYKQHLVTNKQLFGYNINKIVKYRIKFNLENRGAPISL